MGSKPPLQCISRPATQCIEDPVGDFGSGSSRRSDGVDERRSFARRRMDMFDELVDV